MIYQVLKPLHTGKEKVHPDPVPFPENQETQRHSNKKDDNRNEIGIVFDGPTGLSQQADSCKEHSPDDNKGQCCSDFKCQADVFQKVFPAVTVLIADFYRAYS